MIPKFLRELRARIRGMFPAGVPTGLGGEDELDPTVVVRGLELPAHRVWPLRALPDGRRPIVTSRHRSRNPERPNHYGADLLYRYNPATDPPMKIGDGGRTKNYFIPPETRVVAQAAGVVELAGNSRTGWRIWIRHEGGLATGGFHFTGIFVHEGDQVDAGDDIAIVGDNPIDDDPDHLHAELYRGDLRGYPRGTLDPELFWAGAEVLPAKK